MEKKKSELTIVSAYFDIGRGKYQSEYKRGNSKYINYFKFWARMKNNLIIYTQKEFEKEILDIRDSFGLKDKTKVIVVNDIYSIYPDIYKQMCEIEKSEFYKSFRYIKENPDNMANYDYVMFLKTWCMMDAVNNGYIKTDFLAWLDFGFNHGGQIYLDETEFDFLWEYDFLDKIYLSSPNKENNKTILEIIQNGEVYAQGTPYIVPVHLMKEFYDLMVEAMHSLLDIGLIDDDQTLLLMAYRKKKELFNYEINDWFLLLHKYGGEHLKLTPKINCKKESVLAKIIYKYRVYKRNKIYLKGIKKSFLKDYLD